MNLAAGFGIKPEARGKGAIFTLHHVRPQEFEEFAPNAHLSITPEFLEAAIIQMRELGYSFCRLEDIEPCIMRGERVAAFTLDDGYRNNLIHAAPVFVRQNVPFTVFLTRGFVERTSTIWWETAQAVLNKISTLTFDYGDGRVTLPTGTQLEKYSVFDRLAAAIACPDQDSRIAALDDCAASAGIDAVRIVDDLVMNREEVQQLAAMPLASLGAHTLTHANLTHVTAARLDQELVASAEFVREISGNYPACFAYPYGDPGSAGEREYAAAKRAGFNLAVTTSPGVLSADFPNERFSLKRISLNGYYQKTRYINALASGLPFQLLNRAS